MKRAAKIREWLKDNPKSTGAQCAAALGLPSKIVSDSLNLMWRGGIASREGVKYHYLYSVARELGGVHAPEKKNRTPQEIKDRYNATRRKRRARMQQPPRETVKPTQTFTSAPKARPFKHEISTPKPAPVHVKPETIDEWMKRTGAKPEVLGHTNQFQNLRPSDIRTLTPAYVR